MIEIGNNLKDVLQLAIGVFGIVSFWKIILPDNNHK